MVKHVLYNMLGLRLSDPLNLKLLFNGKQLENDRALADYNIGPESSLTVVLGLRGGMDDQDGDAMDDLDAELPEQVPPVAQFNLRNRSILTCSSGLPK